MATRTYPSFFIYKDTAGYWRWRYQAANHRTIADSAEGYNNKQDCMDAIALVKQCWNKEIWE